MCRKFMLIALLCLSFVILSVAAFAQDKTTLPTQSVLSQLRTQDRPGLLWQKKDDPLKSGPLPMDSEVEIAESSFLSESELLGKPQPVRRWLKETATQTPIVQNLSSKWINLRLQFWRLVAILTWVVIVTRWVIHKGGVLFVADYLLGGHVRLVRDTEQIQPSSTDSPEVQSSKIQR